MAGDGLRSRVWCCHNLPSEDQVLAVSGEGPDPGNVEFGLLGPLIVRRDGTAVPVPRGMQRALLATLLLDADRLVLVDELAEILWNSAPPRSARVTVQNHVARLRRALGVSGSRIVTMARGYVIRVGPGELDVSRLEHHVRAARSAERDNSWAAAAAEAAAGLSLWRGGPLADVDCDLLAAREIPRLEELRFQALETGAAARLQLGQHGQVIAELQQLTWAYPLRERLRGLLMLALYRDGRQAEALAAYQHARRIVIEELGTEPGAELRDLQRRILSSEPDLIQLRFSPPDVVRVVPRELPAPVPGFTGRAEELARLTAALDGQGDKPPGPVVISAISGTAGVGKTALAICWAHRVAERFTDGQLYVDLRGYDPGAPMLAAD